MPNGLRKAKSALWEKPPPAIPGLKSKTKKKTKKTKKVSKKKLKEKASSGHKGALLTC